MVSYGDTTWPLKCRFREVAELHQQLRDGLGRMASGLPTLPPKATARSFISGRLDRRFLAARAELLESYFRELLVFIPFVDQCEPLRVFLRRRDEVGRLDFHARMLALMQSFRPESQGADEASIAALPRRDQPDAPSAPASLCVICQEEMLPGEDIRVLPCAHEYHFQCIARWASQKNKCCVCLRAAIPASDDSEESGSEA